MGVVENRMGDDEDRWQPKGAIHAYKGMQVWDHDPGPHEHNRGDFDGDVSFEGLEEDTEVDEDA